MMAKKILDVPKIKQLPGCYCGLASLSMVVQFFGGDIEQEDIVDFFGGHKEVKANGIFYSEGIQCARKIGFITHPYYGLGLEKVIGFIDRGLPIIARIRSKKRGWGHFCVIRGYETDPNLLWVNDPADLRRNKHPYARFSERWNIRRINSPTNHYGIVIRPRDQ